MTMPPPTAPSNVVIGGGNSGSGGSSGGSSGGGGGYSGGGGGAAPTYNYLAQIMAAQQAQRDAAYYAAKAAQDKAYNYARGQVNDATDKALREAYVNRMQTQRNLPQQLSAQGLHGGMSETTTAGLMNNYGNARNNLETNRQDEMGKLLAAYQNNIAQLNAQRYGGANAALTALAPQLGRLVAANTPMSLSMQQGNPEVLTAMLRKMYGLDEEEE